MTLQQIMYFQQVARSGSFTKAARACFVSQTAISRQICALEEELHVTLLERDPQQRAAPGRHRAGILQPMSS